MASADDGHEAGPAGCFQLAGAEVTVQDGWDSAVVVIDDAWVARFPRRSNEVSDARREAGVLHVLARSLPVAVPVPEAFCDRHGAMLYRRIAGAPLDPRGELAHRALVARDVAAALVALRDVPVGDARAAGARDLGGARWRDHYAEVCRRFRGSVLPLVPADHAASAARFLDAFPDATAVEEPESRLAHRDLGPSHLLCDEGGLAGIIDWTDCAIGDPAIDLAWLLHGAPSPFPERIRTVLDPSDAEVDRALGYHRLGPWYEVEHGLVTGRDDLVASGLAGVLERLPLA